MNRKPFASLDIPVLDQQHEEVFDVIDRLYKGIAANEGWLSTYATLERFQDLVAVHFGIEENLMQLHGSLDLQTHIREHREFSVLLLEMLSQSLKKPISTIAVAFIQDWWIKHIAELDTRYAGWFASHSSLEMGWSTTAPPAFQDGAGI